MEEVTGSFALTNITVAFLIAFLASIAAGLLIYKKSKKDTELNNCISLIRDMESKGCEYWSSNRNSDNCLALASEIKRLSKHIGIEIQRIEKIFHRSGFINYRFLTAFRQSITGGDFENANRTTDQKRLKDINNCCADLIKELRK
jgi:hypothetical protein